MLYQFLSDNLPYLFRCLVDGRDTLSLKRGYYAISITVGWVKKRPVSLCATTVSDQYEAILQQFDSIFSYFNGKDTTFS